MTHYDVIIIGGGMVGAALAATLRSNTNIAVIDASPNLKEDERLIALSDSSICLFENIGIWSELVTQAAPIKQIHVSHRGHFGITRMDAATLGLNALGYVIPAKYINAALNSFIESASNIAFLRPAKLEALSQNAEGVDLTISTESGQKQLNAKLVIGADGSYSTVRQLLEIPTEVIDYQQSALVTMTELQRDHHGIAYERFQKEGAIAMLPLPGKQVATIWTERNPVIAELMNLSDDEFLAKLQIQFGFRLGRLKQIGKRSVYPLKMLQVAQQIKQNVLLIGNAAHTVHPIAAQGLNLALYEVAVIAESILKHGVNHFSKEFQADLLAPPQFNQKLAHRLNGLFSSDHFFVNFSRQLGMIAFDLLPPLKKFFAKRAIGKVGHVPKLLIRNNE